MGSTFLQIHLIFSSPEGYWLQFSIPHPYDLWMFCPLPGRFARWMIRPWTIRPTHVDILPHGCFAPYTWTFRPPDILPPELSFVGISPSKCGRTDGRFAALTPKHVQSSHNGINRLYIRASKCNEIHYERYL